MIVLALDTALSACQAAVFDGGAVLARRSEPMARGHQERLAPMAAEVMAEAGLAFDLIDRIAVTVGPGSFTGLRVGLAFAKGLALALDRPAIGIGTLEALAASADPPGLVAAAIDARRGQLYVQAFLDGVPAAAPAMLEIAAAADQLARLGRGAPLTLVGPAADLLRETVPAARIDPRPAPDLAAVARLAARREPAAAPPSPLYLRAPDARTLAERAAAAR